MFRQQSPVISYIFLFQPSPISSPLCPYPSPLIPLSFILFPSSITPHPYSLLSLPWSLTHIPLLSSPTSLSPLYILPHFSPFFYFPSSFYLRVRTYHSPLIPLLSFLFPHPSSLMLLSSRMSPCVCHFTHLSVSLSFLLLNSSILYLSSPIISIGRKFGPISKKEKRNRKSE
jgi:hypothetical protein